MESTLVLGPAAERTLRHMITIAVVAFTALTIHLAGQAAATGPAQDLVQVSSTSLMPGQTVQSYQMTVTNTGSAGDVLVPAPVPAASVTASSTDTGSYADGQWYIGVLETGQTATLDLTAEN